MNKIAFFNIPAYGHTNPTLEVVTELVNRGNEVWYYSFEAFRDKITATGARFLPCDAYDIQMSLKPEDSRRIGRDIAFSTEVIVNTTLAMEEALLEEMRRWKPDCIVADSMALWGKLIAGKLKIPFISSTTTFAFNKYSARIMKQGMGELFRTLLAMPKANKCMEKLRRKGYPVKGVLSLIQNDNDTDTIVYTSRRFQPFAETFSDKYSFIGPSIPKTKAPFTKPEKKVVYISLGTVNTQYLSFFRNCIRAFEDSDMDVIMSVGEGTDIGKLGEIPSNIQVEKTVNQIEILQRTEVFLTHCGMNSVNEALYYEVPLILFPQTTEQGGVAYRVRELGAGIPLKNNSVEALRNAVDEILKNPVYKERVREISKDFRSCAGPEAAADKILKKAQDTDAD